MDVGGSSLKGKCTPIFTTQEDTFPAFLTVGRVRRRDAEEATGLGHVLITFLIAAANVWQGEDDSSFSGLTVEDTAHLSRGGNGPLCCSHPICRGGGRLMLNFLSLFSLLDSSPWGSAAHF